MNFWDTNYIDLIIKLVNSFGVYALKALIITLIGFYLAKFIKKRAKALLLKVSGDETLSTFLAQVANVAILVLTLIILLSVFGVQTASIITVIGTAGIAIALALKDSLSSIASGIVLIILRPYKKGDFVDIDGVLGQIISINLFNTHLTSLDGRIIIIPNSSITSSVIINSAKSEFARIEYNFSISYDADVEQAKKCIFKVIDNMEEVLKDKDIFVGLIDLADSALIICVRVWVNRSIGIFAFKSKLIELVKTEFDNCKIEIPYNKLDVNVKNEIVNQNKNSNESINEKENLI